jgi:phage N-6-adenine-methyltransferase
MNDAKNLAKSVEWYTPAKYIEAARSAFGGTIDLDPASCEKAQEIVKAERYLTVGDDGLALEWSGNVFCNPPYGRGMMQKWIAKCIEEHKKGCNIILLVNANTSEKWFQPLYAYLICFTNHRIRFIDQDGIEAKSPACGNAFIYIGDKDWKFVEYFHRFGSIMQRRYNEAI